MLRISSFNIQNDYGNYDEAKAIELAKYLIDSKIDILGVQELYSKCNSDLERIISKNNYSIYGKYRFFLKSLLKRFNEKTAIITGRRVIFNKTYHLPSFPSPLKRIVTKIVVEESGRLVSIYNTHLEHRNEWVKKRQLKKLITLIKNDSNLIILMGDFNLKNNKEIFNDFVDVLKEIGVYRVEFNEKTFKNSRYKREIDHIFLSNEFNLIEKKVIKDLEVSDHYPIMICVKV